MGAAVGLRENLQANTLCALFWQFVLALCHEFVKVR